MSVKLVKVLQELIKQSIDVNKFSDITYGEVVSDEPVKIKLNDIITLEPENIILTNAVVDHEIDVTVDWYTEEFDVDPNGGHSHDYIDKGMFNIPNNAKTMPHTIGKPNHKHEIKNKKKMIVHNKLKVGEKVLLLKAYGGQKYVVWDRLSKFDCEGEWNGDSNSRDETANSSSSSGSSNTETSTAGNSSTPSQPSEKEREAEINKAKEDVRAIINEEMSKLKVEIRAIIQEELKKEGNS